MKTISILLLFVAVNSYACDAYITGANKLYEQRIEKVLADKGFKMTDKLADSEIVVHFKKVKFFNIYGYPHFFMRKLTLDVIFDESKIFHDYQSDGFPVYTAMGDLMKTLKNSTFKCVNGEVQR